MKPESAFGDLERWARESKDDLRPMPSSVYTSAEMLEQEVDRLFYKEWVCAGHVSELREPGNYLTFDIVDKPVLVVRNEDGDIRAYSNVCRHRAAVLVSGSGKEKLFSCPYHAWAYDLNGCLRAAPHMNKEDVKDISLPRYRVEVWQGLVFVNLDSEAEALAPRLEKLEEHVAPYGNAAYTVVHRAEAEIACNWKVLVENFCESYHVFRVHAKTLEPSSPTSTTRVWEGSRGFNHHTMTFSGDAVTPALNERLPEGLRNLGHLICIYPALAFSIDPASAIWLSVQPTGPQTLKYTAQIALFTADGSEPKPELVEATRSLTAEFMAEDKVTIELVQRGLAADVGNGGVLHPWERTNWEFGHYLAGRMTAA